MQTGRNEPCPCGSGKKYKKCCLDADRAAERAPSVLPPQARALAAEEPVWQADIVPLPIGIDDEPDARPAAVLIVAGGWALHSTILSRPSPEPDDVAHRLERAIMTAATAVGSLPAEVQVRHAEVAEALARRLEPRDVAVGEDRYLEDLVPLAEDLVAGMAGAPRRLGAAWPESWAGWALPSETVVALFAAAADYHRSAPWVWLTDAQALELEMADGRPWTACVLGNGGQQYGLVLYSERSDFERTVEAVGAEEAFAALNGRILSLSFESRDALPRRMRREIASAGWAIDAPSAYPELMTVNTPAGGVTRRDAADLIAALGATARFAERFPEQLAAGEQIEWRDSEAGVTLQHAASEGRPAPSLWPQPGRLAPGGPEGTGAEPESALEWHREFEDIDALADREGFIVDRFEDFLRDVEGLGRQTVEKHTINAGFFVDFVAFHSAVPVRAAHEYDLRRFLYDWYPSKVWDGRTRALAMRTSLRRFFGYLARREGIDYPWADPILDDKDAYEDRLNSSPSGFWWSPGMQEWREPLHADLSARVMLPDGGLGGTSGWGATMGPTEAELHHDLERRWLLWRDEVIRDGATSPPEVRAALVSRQRAWEMGPHEILDGRTPLDAIMEERRERGD